MPQRSPVLRSRGPWVYGALPVTRDCSGAFRIIDAVTHFLLSLQIVKLILNKSFKASRTSLHSVDAGGPFHSSTYFNPRAGVNISALVLSSGELCFFISHDLTPMAVL
jgi:hypothetical protein